MADSPGDVYLKLSHGEALVLFDWLHRCEDENRLSPLVHPGERVALWNLSALLESALTAPFQVDYRQHVNKARDRLAEVPDASASS